MAERLGQMAWGRTMMMLERGYLATKVREREVSRKEYHINKSYSIMMYSNFQLLK